MTLIEFSFYWFWPTAEKSDSAPKRDSLSSLVYQQRKMLLRGYKYLGRRLRRHRRSPLTAVCFASLPTAMAAASRLESLCTQLLTHNLLGSRRKPALEPLPSPLCLSCSRSLPFCQRSAMLELSYDSHEGSERSSLMTSAIFPYQCKKLHRKGGRLHSCVHNQKQDS